MALMTIVLLPLASLPAPSRLQIDYQPGSSGASVTLAATPTPRFSFVPEEDASPPARASVLTAFEIEVKNEVTGALVWGSQKVKASSALNIKCNTPLAVGAYQFSARWWNEEGEVSPTASAKFDVGPTPDVWQAHGSPWFGTSGQREFRLRFNASAQQVRARLYVASPGGSVVHVNGAPAGDTAGVSAWLAYDQRIVYETRAIEGLFRMEGVGAGNTGTTQTVTVGVGAGFYAKPVGDAPCRTARFLVALIGPDGSSHFVGAAGLQGPIEGRAGPVVSDSVKLGTSMDWRVQPTDGWERAVETPQPTPAGKLVPLSIPTASSRGPIRAESVVALGNGTWHYTLPYNLVGAVAIRPEAYKGPGTLRVQHCERLNTSAPVPTCVALSGLEAGVIDTHELPLGAGTQTLRPRFTWHGFQHVFVTASKGASFEGSVDSIAAVWTTASLETSASISFAPDGGGKLLNQLQSMVHASQLSNMAGYIPTDCPTREKHGWLGDAQVTAEEAMYNLWTPTVYELFLNMIRDQQLPTGDAYAGFVPGVVPGTVQKPGDLSWTAAYPLVARWLLLYHGALPVIRDHWLSLKLWADGAIAIAKSKSKDGLPDFFVWGDWCAVEARSIATPGTGPQAAAANFLLAMKAMVHMGKALEEHEDAARYAELLAAGQTAFDARFFNASIGGYVGARPALEHQTLSLLALNALDGAKTVAPAHREGTMELLLADLRSRDHHLTTGSAGQKWLLRTLSASGSHDDALRLATQTTEPAWGYWAVQGATTCWENWSGLADPSHPPEPTHNHIFLCGGLGEWLHRSLGGIAPVGDGYANVTISPKVSHSIGPTSANASVLTVRGRIDSSWIRVDAGAQPARKAAGILSAPPAVGARLRVRVPVGVRALVRLPLLGYDAESVTVEWVDAEEGGRPIWPQGARTGSTGGRGLLSIETSQEDGGGKGLLVTVLAGAYEFLVTGPKAS
jgi:alpha-L-rhamnosidase